MFVTVAYSWAYLPGSSKKASINKNFVTLPKIDFNFISGSILIFISFGVLYEIARFVWQPILNNSGIDIQTLGILYAVLQVASLLGGVIAAKLSFSRHLFVIVASAMSLSLAGLIMRKSVVIVTSLIVLQISENVYRVLQSAYLNHIVKSKRATFLSAANLFKNATGAFIICAIGLLSPYWLTTAILLFILIKACSIAYLFSKMHDLQKMIH
jgi:hypothetical protein